ncbi:hypothetical protein GLOIN_2v1678278 [Rhizophagus irregularis DAOM 181602=DAOM 197198]|uniref:Uncharacterized protein n=1 Tax=Rhizophagus irregularis (strain DAOM 181602 / DAOM 197198 / MUCL 43194) TaxID=747089 RepID=A0A2P4PFN8_RHIID|nr:hypothetical protein GLOIN_2v1678278 [Rhizophagus irregularis DAOM 181602=DAOM 197198]POG64170.1 hypothetical protein GLOIN_2v1678278 [Rhizophagus irregularis DAOM 181602=DAOM 197198]GET53824.1 hypothetical protein GLOIN_2v1678278 [Rhizophagus irregularis DAOM 181602=DAOM 197198]|eukprot:XP_025171036.1 hypothetical protein GLOIN_2v1678278 [Rhizophagus irregularis DAOM 181602=DAOM 197198]
MEDETWKLFLKKTMINTKVLYSFFFVLEYRTKGALGSIGHEYSVSSDDAALLSQWSVFFGELVVARCQH